MKVGMARLMGLAVMMAILLAVTPIPALARVELAAERAANQAQDAVQNSERAVDEAMNEARSTKWDTTQNTVGAEQETGSVTTPESGGISIGKVVLLLVGGSGAFAIGGWLFIRRATLMGRHRRRALGDSGKGKSLRRKLTGYL